MSIFERVELPRYEALVYYTELQAIVSTFFICRPGEVYAATSRKDFTLVCTHNLNLEAIPLILTAWLTSRAAVPSQHCWLRLSTCGLILMPNDPNSPEILTKEVICENTLTEFIEA